MRTSPGTPGHIKAWFSEVKFISPPFVAGQIPGLVSPYKREVTGSSPVAPTKFPQLELNAGDVQQTLDALADRLSTRILQILRNCLERAIRHAEVRGLVGRNVAAVVKPPRGTAGRPSKSLTLEQAQALLQTSLASGYTAAGRILAVLYCLPEFRRR